MENRLDQYDFSTASQKGEPGIETFQNTTDGRYYFRFNDKNGAAILFSQGYMQAKGRDTGLNSVKNNALVNSHFVLFYLNDGKSFQFALFAANRQEIARSVVFDSEKKMQSAMTYFKTYMKTEMEGISPKKKGESPQNLMKTAPSNVLESPMESDLEVHQTDIELSNAVTLGSGSPSEMSNPIDTAKREIFRIELYRQSEEAMVKGKIIHALSKAERLIEGLDGNNITHFIAPYFESEPSASPQKATAVTTSSSVSKKGQSNRYISTKPIGISIETSGTTQAGVENRQPFTVRLTLLELKQGIEPHYLFFAKVFATDLLTHESRHLIQRKVHFASDGHSLIHLPPNLLSPGAYRFTVSLTIDDGHLDMDDRNRYYGTCLVQVV
jgi:uncharacterized protein YegP (UPF0339 family)